MSKSKRCRKWFTREPVAYWTQEKIDECWEKGERIWKAMNEVPEEDNTENNTKDQPDA